MSSDDGMDVDADAEILRLDAEGLSPRQIAKRVGLSRSTVRRRINDAREAEAELEAALAADDDDLEADELALVDASGDDYQPVPPFTFVGIVPGDSKTEDDWRYVDRNSHPVSSLDIYRYGAALDEAERYDEADAFRADLERQYAEAGLRRVDYIGYHRWERPISPEHHSPGIRC